MLSTKDQHQRRQQQGPSTRSLTMERLERRDLLYNLSGRAWDHTDLSVSFVDDGTAWEQGPASTYQALNQTALPDVWQETAARSFQLWANVTPLNFRWVEDDAAPIGVAGDHGDIRVAVADSWAGAAHAVLPELGEVSGEITFHSNFDYDTRTVDGGFARLLVHEIGHSLGLLHELDKPSAMRGLGYFGITSDDIAGIQAIYGARAHDSFDQLARNDSVAAATMLTGKQLEIQADLTNHADVDFYQLSVPAGTQAMTIRVDAERVSFLAPEVHVYVGGELIAEQSTHYGGVIELPISGLAAGEEVVVRVDGVDDPQFGMGAYFLGVDFSAVTAPPANGGSTAPPTSPDRSLADLPVSTPSTAPPTTTIVPDTQPVELPGETRDATPTTGSAADRVDVGVTSLLPSWFARRVRAVTRTVDPVAADAMAVDAIPTAPTEFATASTPIDGMASETIVAASVTAPQVSSITVTTATVAPLTPTLSIASEEPAVPHAALPTPTYEEPEGHLQQPDVAAEVAAARHEGPEEDWQRAIEAIVDELTVSPSPQVEAPVVAEANDAATRPVVFRPPSAMPVRVGRRAFLTSSHVEGREDDNAAR